LIVVEDGFRGIARAKDQSDGRCIALAGPVGGPYGCTLYDDRPRACRELLTGGRHCLTARRRVGLSLGAGPRIEA
jgi:Fe-S-cluster containining protein